MWICSTETCNDYNPAPEDNANRLFKPGKGNPRRMEELRTLADIFVKIFLGLTPEQRIKYESCGATA